MPQYNVTLKSGASEDKIQEAKKKAQDGGGTIVKEFSLIKGFTVSYPDGKVNALSSDDHVTVEADGQVSTQ